ncbi:MAG TPA: hypothetical protein VFC84_01960 [Desulfosporosinus sp.]|nr:hypothetical protein [Desulfosporosinus sp.]
MLCQISESKKNDHCDKLTGIYKKDLITCGRCREVVKIDLVRIITKMEKIYLTETIRHKDGRKYKLTDMEQQDITYAHKTGQSMDELAKKYKVSKGTIFNVLHRDK